MFLLDKNADVILRNSDYTSLEVWWLKEADVTVVSHCPENYPTCVVHTMKVKDAVRELSVLLNTGWYIDNLSEKFYEHCSPKLRNRVEHLRSSVTDSVIHTRQRINCP